MKDLPSALSAEALRRLGGPGPATAERAGIQVQKAFMATGDAFRKARPNLGLRQRSDLLMAGAEALFAKHAWRPGIEAMKKRHQDWRDPRPPARYIEDLEPETAPPAYGPDEITTVKLEGWFLDIVDAFVASHAAEGFHTRRQILEEGARTLMFDAGWLPEGTAKGRRKAWRDPRS